jgi:hypothetical protein
MPIFLQKNAKTFAKLNPEIKTSTFGGKINLVVGGFS